jgi:hypothetical protein
MTSVPYASREAALTAGPGNAQVNSYAPLQNRLLKEAPGPDIPGPDLDVPNVNVPNVNPPNVNANPPNININPPNIGGRGGGGGRR